MRSVSGQPRLCRQPASMMSGTSHELHNRHTRASSIRRKGAPAAFKPPHKDGEHKPPKPPTHHGGEAHDDGRLHAGRAQEVGAGQVAHVVRHLRVMGV